jgi:hypothetical protein
VLGDLLRHVLDDLNVRLDEIVATHARLAGQAGGDHDHIGVLGVGVIGGAGDVHVEPLGGPALDQVEHAPLDGVLHLRNVQDDHVAQFLAGRPQRAHGAHHSAADD